MGLKEDTMKLLAATDSSVWLTYDEYACTRISDGGMPITVDQWDVLISIAGNRKLQDTVVVSQLTDNLKAAAFGDKTPKAEDKNQP